jgi:hypothetical protein
MTDVGNLTSLSDYEVNSSPKDDIFLSVKRSSIKYHNVSSSDVEEFFYGSLSSNDGETVDDFSIRCLVMIEPVEDTDFHVDNHTKCHQSQVAPRKLHRLNQHPYAPPGSPVSPREPINARLPGPNPTCPCNRRCLHAAQI